jgi:D-aminoacyl-tRNA deacylase
VVYLQHPKRGRLQRSNHMRAVVQRVSRAQVSVNGEIAGKIGLGLLVLLGVGCDDTEADASYLADKIAGLRVFEDDRGKMNRSVRDAGGSVLAISQFTLYGDVRRGKRPSFDSASAGKSASALRVLCGADPLCRAALRDRALSGNDEGGTGERRSGDHSAGFGEGVLDLSTVFISSSLGGRGLR